MLYIIGLVVLATSFLFSMLGLGGGMVYVPLLHWMGLDLKTEAIPVGLLLNGITTGLAFIVYLRKGLVDWKGIWPMIFTAIAGAPIGAMVEPYVPHNTLILLFVMAVLAAATKMLWSAFSDKKAAQELGKKSGSAEIEELAPLKTRLLIGGGSGLVIGFISGMLGIGGGFIIAPLLITLGYPVKKAAGTTAMVAAFLSVSGFSAHVMQGHMPLNVVLVGGLAVLVGALSGSTMMSNFAKPVWIKQVYGIVLLFIAAKLVWGVL